MRPFKDSYPEKISFTVVEGEERGPALLLTAGIHGGEYVGVNVTRYAGVCPPRKLKGMLVIGRVVSVESFRKRRAFTTPQDDKNLNRQFQGEENGTFSQRLAYWLQKLFERPKQTHEHCFYIDLHSGDIPEDLMPLTFFNNNDTLSREIALAANFHWNVVSQGAGQAINGAYQAGVPGFIMEVGGHGRWTEAQVLKMLSAISQVMRHLGMLRRLPDDTSLQDDEAASNLVADFGFMNPPTPIPRDRCVSKAYDINAPVEGFWHAAKAIGASVESGELLGTIQDIRRHALHKVKSPVNGVYLYGWTALPISKGDPVSSIGEVVELIGGKDQCNY